MKGNSNFQRHNTQVIYRDSPEVEGGPPPATTVVKDVLTTMSTPITLLDITLLSQLRKDGHPSVYGLDGKHGNDCSHWCLAGVPDSWNELLYAILVTTD
ncbi:hypothetical protein C1H46_011275 [Malus baccata]|uniref:Trichome birefringence-like C-terminal domain-containing protein n=1 Tax=Malus baccata TaxID=106549 RepID=A0A540MWD1_MALBA|nr:hypothetical protein C1H46_011275 [Malus baccata]